jgi:lipopolysaccharide export system permease protein
LKDETNEYPRIIFAKKGELLVSTKMRILRLTDGKFININKSGKATSFNFKTTDFNLSKFLTKTTTHTKLQEKKLSMLVMCINFVLIKKETYYNQGINCNNESINEIMSEVYTRVFKPLFLFLLSSIVIFLLSSNIENKNFNLIKGFVFSLGIVSIILSEIFVDYSGKNTSNMLVAILFPLIVFFILYLLFYTQVNRANNKT